MRKVDIPSLNFDGLAKFSLSELGRVSELGTPLMLPLSDIEEDPENARQEFKPQSLEELAASIRAAGRVLEPISVRSVNGDGKYRINSGARRFRAALLIGLTEIPAYVDAEADEFSRFIVNEQRENLSPMDIAAFITRYTNHPDPEKRMTHAQIADKIGKSRQYVSQHAALMTLPDVLRGLYDRNVCRSPTSLSELTRLHKRNAALVEEALKDAVEVTATVLQSLRETVKTQMPPQETGNTEEGDTSKSSANKTRVDRNSWKPTEIEIIVKYKEASYRLWGKFTTLDKPPEDRSVYVVRGRDDLISAPVDELRLETILFNKNSV